MVRIPQGIRISIVKAIHYVSRFSLFLTCGKYDRQPQ